MYYKNVTFRDFLPSYIVKGADRIMNDGDIIGLFFERSEDALAEVQGKYGRLCRKIAYGILKNYEDMEECVDTAYMSLWNSIPPKKPDSLCSYLCTIVRNAAFELYSKRKYRGYEEPFDELSEVISDKETARRLSDGIELSSFINAFLDKEKPLNRKLFVGRYYYNLSVSELSERLNMSESAVKTRLSRIRGALRSYLEEQGINV